VAHTDLCDGGNVSIHEGAIDAMTASPDGAHVAVLVHLELISLDTWLEDDRVVVLPAAAVTN
jgi:hypothetical protein